MKNLVNLENKTILVTGSSSGIGKQSAILLSQLGAKLVLVGRNVSTLESTLSLLEGSGHEVAQFDFNNCDQIESWVKSLCTKVGKISGVLHCAGIQISEPLRFIEEGSIDLIFNTNVKSSILLIKSIRKNRAFQTSSSIILLSSITGVLGETGMAVYAASKAALIALTKSLAKELASDGIRINCVAPAIVKTEMSDRMLAKMGEEDRKSLESKHCLGLGEPTDIANLNAFLLSDASRWMTGSCIIIDGGYSLK